MPYRKLRLGQLEIAVGIPEQAAGKLRSGALWRLLNPKARYRQALSSHSENSAAIRKEIENIDWYHSIDVGGGVVTPGVFDLRAALHHYPIPERLDGQRVLDVGTYDGFWAFEFEARGAREVVAVDVDTFGDLDLHPEVRKSLSDDELGRKMGAGFAVAQRLRGSKVTRLARSVYDLSPADLGQFDFVFAGSLLLHLRHPALALEKIAGMIRGSGLIVEAFNPGLPGLCAEYKGGLLRSVYWSFSLDALSQVVADTGFSSVERGEPFRLTNAREHWILWHAPFTVWP